jgi:hypothetical protein
LWGRFAVVAALATLIATFAATGVVASLGACRGSGRRRRRLRLLWRRLHGWCRLSLLRRRLSWRRRFGRALGWRAILFATIATATSLAAAFVVALPRRWRWGRSRGGLGLLDWRWWRRRRRRVIAPVAATATLAAGLVVATPLRLLGRRTWRLRLRVASLAAATIASAAPLALLRLRLRRGWRRRLLGLRRRRRLFGCRRQRAGVRRWSTGVRRLRNLYAWLSAFAGNRPRRGGT